MIKSIYETHVQVTDMDRSIKFFEKLGLTVGLRFGNNAFLWVGPEGDTTERRMLGLAQTSVADFRSTHFAFKVDEKDILTAKQWLNELDIETDAVFGKDNSEPIIHPWMPAAAVYFKDPDGNQLELLAELSNVNKQVDHLVTLSEWYRLQEQ